jgi:hypothetical protein
MILGMHAVVGGIIAVIMSKFDVRRFNLEAQDEQLQVAAAFLWHLRF